MIWWDSVYTNSMNLITDSRLASGDVSDILTFFFFWNIHVTNSKSNVIRQRFHWILHYFCLNSRGYNHGPNNINLFVWYIFQGCIQNHVLITVNTKLMVFFQFCTVFIRYLLHFLFIFRSIDLYFLRFIFRRQWFIF